MRSPRKHHFFNTELNRVQTIDNKRYIVLNVSEYNIGYIISVTGIKNKTTQEELEEYGWVKYKYNYKNQLIIDYNDAHKYNHIIYVDYMER
jgi:hypothetical protein